MQAVLQQIGKEMVVAVPAPLVVQGDDKEVVAFEIFQDLLTSGGGEDLGSRGVVIPLALLLLGTAA